MSAQDAAVAAQGEKTVETSEQGLLDQIVAQGRFARDTASLERGRDMVKEFVAQVLEGHMTLTRDAEATIQARIASSSSSVTPSPKPGSALGTSLPPSGVAMPGNSRRSAKGTPGGVPMNSSPQPWLPGIA